jgi:hypothetical protein
MKIFDYVLFFKIKNTCKYTNFFNRLILFKIFTVKYFNFYYISE